MNKHKNCLIIIMAMMNLLINRETQAQQEQAPPQQEAERDPFIPLIDERGNLRKEFKKPSQEAIAPQVILMGISKVGNTFYALIDGELVKEGQLFKEMRIEKIYSDRVIVFYGNKIFQLKWGTGNKNEKK